jgi:hypothetical protein
MAKLQSSGIFTPGVPEAPLSSSVAGDELVAAPPAPAPPAGDDDAIDRKFSAVSVARDHVWLDQLTRECALEFVADQGYDLKDYIHGGFVADWWSKAVVNVEQE